MAKHETSARSDEWYTPAYVFEALGTQFDLDPCPGPADCPAAGWARCIALGLDYDWRGFVWMNPPFGGRNGLTPWLDKFFTHCDGIALTPDRTSAPWWQAAAPRADAVLFWAPKIHFLAGPGATASSPAQGTTLMACGDRGVAALQRAAGLGRGVLMVRR